MDEFSHVRGDDDAHARIVAGFAGWRRGEREEKAVHTVFPRGVTLEFAKKKEIDVPFVHVVNELVMFASCG